MREREEAGAHQLVAGVTLDVRDEGDATGVVLETRIVEISPSVGRGHGPLPRKSERLGWRARGDADPNGESTILSGDVAHHSFTRR